jgi:chemotaxis methyl-accepting protein methylase
MEGEFIPQRQLDKASELLEEALSNLTLSDTEFARYERHYHIAPKIDLIRANIQQAIGLLHPPVTHEEK